MGGNQLLHITTLLKRLGIVLGLFTSSRIIFYLFNADLFPEVTLPRFLLIMLVGLPYDVVAILAINVVFIMLHAIPNPWRDGKGYQAALKVLFYLFNGAALILEAGDFIYYEFAQQRTSTHILGLINDIPGLVPQFLSDFWYLLAIIVVLTVGVEWLYRKASRRLKRHPVTNNYRLQMSVLPVVVLVCAIGIGSFADGTLSPPRAARYVHVDEIGLVTNTTFTCLQSIANRRLIEKNYLTKSEAESEFPIFHEMTGRHHDADAKRPNVVVLIMESFSKEYIGFFNGGRGFTPCLDSILEGSVVYDRAFANGKHSIDALSSVALGLPALMNDSYISSPYFGNKVIGIGNLIRPLGYSTYFFHGGRRGTLSFDRFVAKAGFDHHFGMEEHGNIKDYDGNWGIYDDPFMQFTAEQLNASQQPFCAIFFSLSSHHPFTIPEQHRSRFPATDIEMEAPIRYADYALGRFFQTVSQHDWYENTLFIITADHTGPVYQRACKNRLGHYAIPVALYHPGSVAEADVKHEVVQQTDILPTILDYVGYNGKFMAFGSSMLRDSTFRFSVNQMNDIFQIVSGDYLLQFSGDRVLGLYNFIDDPDLDVNLVGTTLPQEAELERKLKAIIQQFRYALIHNRMTPS